MRIKAPQLHDTLDGPIAPAYLVGSAEMLLAQECRDAIIRAAQREGFSERMTFHVEGRFDWATIEESSGAPSLFATRRILDIRIPTARPGREGAETLRRLVDEGDPDTLVLVSTTEWAKAIGQTKWVGAFDKAGVVVEIWSVGPGQLPQWIAGRLKRAGVAAQPDAIHVLAELVEGNLLAAQQEIDKLALSPRETPLTAADIEQWVANSARFDSFRLIDCMLAGRLGDCLRVAGGLQRIDVAIQAVSGALHHEISMMMGAHRTQAAGKGLEAYFRSRRIWPARQAAIRGAMNRLGMGALQKAMLLLARIDRQGKGMAPGDPWQTLDDLLAVMCTERGRSPGGAVV